MKKWFFYDDDELRAARADARCAGADTNIFYPPEQPTKAETTKATRSAKMICNGTDPMFKGLGPCPIKEQCLEVAIARDEQGVWGGTDARQRRSIKRARRVAARARKAS